MDQSMERYSDILPVQLTKMELANDHPATMEEFQQLRTYMRELVHRQEKKFYKGIFKFILLKLKIKLLVSIVYTMEFVNLIRY